VLAKTIEASFKTAKLAVEIAIGLVGYCVFG
jgi:spore maturation protein SpmA